MALMGRSDSLAQSNAFAHERMLQAQKTAGAFSAQVLPGAPHAASSLTMTDGKNINQASEPEMRITGDGDSAGD